MTTTRWMAALVAALLLFLALPAPSHAQSARKTMRIWNGTAADTTAVGMADSTGSANATGILSTALYQRLYLRLKPNRPCRVAIQIREYGISDTANTSIPSDSTQGAVWSWRGFTQTLAAGLSDSLSLSRITTATSTVVASDELVINFPDDQAVANGKWGGPRAIYLPLRNTDGAWYWGQYTNIRIRVLQAGGVVTWVGAVKGVSW